MAIDLEKWVEKSLGFLTAATIEISHRIALDADRLPDPFHKDPADRLLVATARLHGLRVVTADDLILQYPHIQSIDARD